MKKSILKFMLVLTLVCCNLSILTVSASTPIEDPANSNGTVVIRPFNDLPDKPEPK